MLSFLHIENIAVIDRADIEFGPGLNVLTGETGAGKSIVIDALEASLGWRAVRELVRAGAGSALVSATFTDCDDAWDWCRENGVEREDELVLTRRLSEDGKSSCRVNGVPVPAFQARQLGLRLIDIHGQSDGQRLADERWHLSYLDGFAGLTEELEAYRAAYAGWKALRDALDALTLDGEERERRADALRFQIEEIERARIRPGELEEKMKRRDFLMSAGKLAGSVAEADAYLSGTERSDGAASLIGSAAACLTRALRWSKELEGLSQKLTDLKYAAGDAAEELRAWRERLEVSPEELDALDARLDVLKRVTRRYGGSEEAALETLERAKRELDELEFSQEKAGKLEGELAAAGEKVVSLAGKLSERRRGAAEALAGAVERELRALSMPGARFQVELTARSPGPDGADEARFLLAANAGEGFGRLAKAASGGELSRVMLAMKTALARADPVGAMVFDEIDAGISGVAAQRVAEKLAAIGRARQVICVTHLPQIAAMADTQFAVAKRVEGGRTFTDVTKLDNGGRRAEIARLTGGDNVTETALLAASEQLEAAERFKEGLKA